MPFPCTPPTSTPCTQRCCSSRSTTNGCVASSRRTFARIYRVIESFISHQQETGYISSRFDAHVLAVSSHAIINGLLLNIAAGMDREEAKKIWITTVDALLQAG